MKLQILLLIISFFSIVTSLPVYPGPQLHTFDTNRKSENDLYLERWQKNFGNRLTKPPTYLPPTELLAKPTNPKPAAAGAISDIPNSATKPSTLTITQKKDEKPETLPIKPVSPSNTPPTPLNPAPAAGPIFMHGALGFLKPKAPAPIPAGPKSAFVMPPNTMTKADLINQIASQVSQDCPGCGRDLKTGGGWKSRFAAWIKEVWRRVYEAVHPAKKVHRHPELPGIWWVDGEGF